MKSADRVRWDLRVMYTNIADPQIDADLVDFGAKAKAFHERRKGKIAETLGHAIAEYAEIDMLGNKLTTYLFLRQSTEVANAEIKAKIAQVERAIAALQGEYLTFFELELAALDERTLETWYARDSLVAKHRPWIEHIRVFKPHFLSEPVEAALTKRSPFGSSAWSEFFDEAETDLEFPHGDGTKTLAEMLHILSESKDADKRAQAMQRVNEGLSGHFAKYSAQTLYMIVGSKMVEDKERGYRHPMDLRNKSNRIPDEVVQALHTAVIKDVRPLARRYYRLKAKHLGVSVLRWSDRNAPMPFSDAAEIPFDEARTIVKAAYQSFSPTLAQIVAQCFVEKRIDAPAIKGKRNGAFNSSLVLPGGKSVSFTLLNYLGSNRDVMTLAHELGHGVHGILAGEAQGPLMFHAPIAYCETASVFGEMTTFRFLQTRLMERADTPSLLALLMATIDDLLNTVLRQIAFSNFERRMHGIDASYTEWHEPKKLSVEELDALWLAVTKELYGEENEVFTYAHMEHLWTYVSHFHRPFYVYGYAFGELLTQGLYAEKEHLGERFEPLYLDLLRSGATKNVVDLLAPFGLDPRKKAFWADGIAAGIGALVAEAERLSREMGIL